MASGAPAVRVDGARQLRRTLRRAGDDLADFKDAHAAAARIVGQAAAPRVPRVSGALAGTLRFSGTVSSAIIRAGYATVPYANAIHWGWPSHNVAAQPFIWGAALDTRPEWMGEYLESINDILSHVRGV